MQSRSCPARGEATIRRAPDIKRIRVHPLEHALLWLVTAHLVVLPWALGGMRPWAQIPSLALGALAFGLALLPRNYTEDHTTGPRFRMVPWTRLVRFPIFWLGLALLGYIGVQALNPAWEYQRDQTNWWMSAVPHLRWLPAGYRAPFERWNEARLLVIYGAAWLMMCAIWVGFTQRRSLQVLLTALAANGVVLAVYGVALRLFGNERLFWVWESPNAQFFASFVYKNHAAVYLALMLGVTWGLAGWFYIRGLRRMEKSDPGMVIAFLAICIAASILISQARGATLVMLAFMCLAFATFILHQFRLPREARQPVVLIGLLIVTAVFLKPGIDALGARDTLDRLRQGIAGEDPSLKWRTEVTKASLEMLGDHWPRGIGAGGFRHLFPIYQHRHPELVTRFGKRIYWEHAHNDIVQFPIELGITGTLLLLAAGAYYVASLVRARFWQSPLVASIVASLVLVLLYSWWDFPFQNPAILLTAGCLWTVSVLWLRASARLPASDRGPTAEP